MKGCGVFILIFLPPFLATLALGQIYGPDAGGLVLPIVIGWLIVVFIGFRVYYGYKYRVTRTKDDHPRMTSAPSGYSGYSRHRGNCPSCGTDLDTSDPHAPGCPRGGGR